MPRLVTLVVCLASATNAIAQPMAIDEFRPAVDSRGFLGVNGSSVLGHAEPSFGLGSLAWGKRVDATVDDVVTATIVAAIGVRLGPIPLELGASVPLAVTSGAVDQQGMGDMGVHLKARLARFGRFGFAAITSAYVPVDTNDRGTSTQVVGIVDAELGAWRFAANGGARRTTTMGFSDTVVPFGVAGAWALARDKFEVVGEVFGTLGSDRRLEALGGVKLYLARNSYLMLGIGHGFTPTSAPNLRTMIGIVFEPKAARRGRIHVENVDRQIMKTEELRDQLPPCTTDCPDEDRDLYAAIPDVDESCARDPECVRRRVTVEDSRIVTFDNIEFEFDKAIIRPRSYPILDAVAAALKAHGDIDLLEVRGHTDERGDADYNKGLSERRAAAVVAYLTSHGIAAERLTWTGFGKELPLDRAHDEVAWKKNRRVEFQIRKRAGQIL